MDARQVEGAVSPAERELQGLLVEALEGPGIRLCRLFQSLADSEGDPIKLSLTFTPNADLQALMSWGKLDA